MTRVGRSAEISRGVAAVRPARRARRSSPAALEAEAGAAPNGGLSASRTPCRTANAAAPGVRRRLSALNRATPRKWSRLSGRALGAARISRRPAARVEGELSALQAQARSRATSRPSVGLISTRARGGPGTALDEAPQTRRLIDAQAPRGNSEGSGHGTPSAPQGSESGTGRPSFLAIAEWPTKRPCRLCAVRADGCRRGRGQAHSQGRVAVIQQAKRYCPGYAIRHRGASEGARGASQVPFVFATNGRPYLNGSRPRAGSGSAMFAARPIQRALEGWYTPEGLRGAEAGHDPAHEDASGVDLRPQLRDYRGAPSWR